jgi:Skp family chaperone for outer membrane proteins
MSGKTAMTGILLGAGALFLLLGHNRAESQTTGAGATTRIGIVSIRNVFNGSRRHAQYRAQAMKRQSQARTQVDDLTKEIEAEEAELKTLRQGTADYMKQLQVALDKRAKLDGLQEYLKQQRALEDKKWMEDLYQEVLKIVRDMAKEKGLDLVLERTEPEFPISSDELMLTLSTHKVLYDGGCLDLTAEVVTRLDAAETGKSPGGQ